MSKKYSATFNTWDKVLKSCNSYYAIELYQVASDVDTKMMKEFLAGTLGSPKLTDIKREHNVAVIVDNRNRSIVAMLVYRSGSVSFGATGNAPGHRSHDISARTMFIDYALLGKGQKEFLLKILVIASIIDSLDSYGPQLFVAKPGANDAVFEQLGLSKQKQVRQEALRNLYAVKTYNFADRDVELPATRSDLQLFINIRKMMNSIFTTDLKEVCSLPQKLNVKELYARVVRYENMLRNNINKQKQNAKSKVPILGKESLSPAKGGSHEKYLKYKAKYLHLKADLANQQ